MPSVSWAAPGGISIITLFNPGGCPNLSKSIIRIVKVNGCRFLEVTEETVPKIV
jgi:hypothetical protein